MDHKHEHGFLYQGVVTPDGMIRETWSPGAGHANDNGDVGESFIKRDYSQRQLVIRDNNSYNETANHVPDPDADTKSD